MIEAVNHLQTAPRFVNDGLASERIVLGILLVDPTASDDRLTAELFTSERHRLIFEAIERLRLNRMTRDIALVARELRRVKYFSPNRIESDLATLCESVTWLDSLGDHVSAMLEDSQRRMGIAKAKRLARDLGDLSRSPTEIERRYGVSGVVPRGGVNDD